MNTHLSLCAQERIRVYEIFKPLIDKLTAIEADAERFRQVLDARDCKNYWMVVSQWQRKPIFKIELRKTERLADVGPLVEAFEEIWGEVTGTEDETERQYSQSRRFITPRAELLVEVPHDSLTCKRVPTGETEVVQKYRLECVENAA